MMTFSQLQEHAAQLEAEGLLSEQSLISEKGAKASPEEILGKVCGIYHKVRPFLEVVASLFFIPKKWRQAIQTFMGILDGLCPAMPEI